MNLGFELPTQALQCGAQAGLHRTQRLAGLGGDFRVALALEKILVNQGELFLGECGDLAAQGFGIRCVGRLILHDRFVRCFSSVVGDPALPA